MLPTDKNESDTKCVPFTERQKLFLSERAPECWKQMQKPISQWMENMIDPENSDEPISIPEEIFPQYVGYDRTEECCFCRDWDAAFCRTFYAEWYDFIPISRGFNLGLFQKLLNGFMKHVREHDMPHKYIACTGPPRDTYNQIPLDARSLAFLKKFNAEWYDILANNKLENYLEHHSRYDARKDFVGRFGHWNEKCTICDKMSEHIEKCLPEDFDDDWEVVRPKIRRRRWIKILDLAAEHWGQEPNIKSNMLPKFRTYRPRDQKCLDSYAE